MRKVSAHYVFSVSGPPLKNGIITIGEDGAISDVTDNPKGKEFAGVEFYNGVLVPGFVNCHVHLELSHLKGHALRGSKLAAFIDTMVTKREVGKEEINKAMYAADRIMVQNGIVAAGDVMNSDVSLEVKKQSRILYFNFIEVYGYSPDIKSQFNKANKLKELFSGMGAGASVTPHSFYALTTGAINMVLAQSVAKQGILSIHYLESFEELDFLCNRKGKLYDFLKTRNEGNNIPDMIKGSPSAWLSNIAGQLKSLLLVHNTYADEKDILAYSNLSNIYRVICPNSNLFIENRLPDINLFRRNQCHIVLGTDSLASNDSLDILGEIKVLLKHFPEIPFDEALAWATLNGAKALGLDKYLGTFEPGKKPGINLINAFDFAAFRPTNESNITVIH